MYIFFSLSLTAYVTITATNRDILCICVFKYQQFQTRRDQILAAKQISKEEYSLYGCIEVRLEPIRQEYYITLFHWSSKNMCMNNMNNNLRLFIFWFVLHFFQVF